MKIDIPLETDKEFLDYLTNQVLRRIEEKSTNLSSVNDLPPYPNRKQVKKGLRIGDERLNHWIASGLKVIPFGKEARFDREDIKEFLDQLKV
ncbi:DNA-binding protein [Enterococcus gallinarum]|uniref:DNA-binding protein n=1 Tax=Enterococcus gallinarum TaxID=1353 RepID=UPI002DB5A757|nr:DNA-binding protein [Enterococcus gallinarum]MEB5970134.1 DNA-binding protein [Enterococcus gallinarum]